jgi:hypothetical protein
MPHIPGHVEDQLPTGPNDPFARPADPDNPIDFRLLAGEERREALNSFEEEELSYGDMIYNYLGELWSSWFDPDDPVNMSLTERRGKSPAETKPWLNIEDYPQGDYPNLTLSAQETVNPSVLEYSTYVDSEGRPMIGEGSYWDYIYWTLQHNPTHYTKRYGDSIEEGVDFTLPIYNALDTDDDKITIKDFDISDEEQHIVDVATGLIGTETYRVGNIGGHIPAHLQFRYDRGQDGGRTDWQQGFGIYGQDVIEKNIDIYEKEPKKRSQAMRINRTCVDSACDIYTQAGIPFPVGPDGKALSHIETVIDVLDGRKFVEENKDIIKGYKKMKSLKDIQLGSMIFLGSQTDPEHTVIVTDITEHGIIVVDEGGDGSAKKTEFHTWHSLAGTSGWQFVAGYNYIKPVEK